MAIGAITVFVLGWRLLYAPGADLAQQISIGRSWGVFVTGVGMSGERAAAGHPSFPGAAGVRSHRVCARRDGLCA